MVIMKLGMRPGQFVSMTLFALTLASPCLGSAPVDALTARLGAATWREREDASSALLAAAMARPELAETLVGKFLQTPDPEARARLKAVIRAVVREKLYRNDKGFIGVQLQDNLAPVIVDDKPYRPILIVAAMPGHAAEKAGVEGGSLILKLDGQVCDSKFRTAELIAYISAKKAGDHVALTLLGKDKRPMTMDLVLGARPESEFDPAPDALNESFFQRWFAERVGKRP